MSQGQPRRTHQGWFQDQRAGGGSGAQGGGGGAGRDGPEGGHVASSTDKITIGEALETAGRTAAHKPVDRTDAAAITAAEAAATGHNVVLPGGGVILPGGVAAAAHLAADANTWVAEDDHKTKLGDVLTDAVTRLPADKEVTREVAVQVASAEIRSTPNLEARPGGLAATVRAAAKLNEDR